MKISVSLTHEELERLDHFIEQENLPGRSAGIQRALRNLTDHRLEDAYAQAFTQWSGSEDEAAWETATGDGADDAAR